MEREEVERRTHGGEAHRTSLPHELWQGRGCISCRRCGRESTAGKPIPTFGADACKGTAAGRILASNTGNINFLWSKFRHDKNEMAIRGLTLTCSRPLPRAVIDEARLQEVCEEHPWPPGALAAEGVVGDDDGEVGERVEVEVGAVGEAGGELGAEGTGRRHRLRTRGCLVWCDYCGAYSAQRAGARLRGTCEGRPTTRHRTTRLNRLRMGRHPITNVPLA